MISGEGFACAHYSDVILASRKSKNKQSESILRANISGVLYEERKNLDFSLFL